MHDLTSILADAIAMGTQTAAMPSKAMAVFLRQSFGSQ